jgi:hypothetical protein
MWPDPHEVNFTIETALLEQLVLSFFEQVNS